MDRVLVTGGAGFVGGVVKRGLIDAGRQVVSVDLISDADSHPNLSSKVLDITDSKALEALFKEHQFAAVYHFATDFVFRTKEDERRLWRINVTATATLRELCEAHGVKHLCFTSSFAVWGQNFEEPVNESMPTAPIEYYGISKVEGEKILLQPGGGLNVCVYRLPVVMDKGRRGALGLLFEFIEEGRAVWTVGDGSNRIHFLYAGDLVDAVLRGERLDGKHLFHIGSDDVGSLAEAFQFVIDKAGTGARLRASPEKPALFLLDLARRLRLSPLGIYQSKMISSSFIYDTAKIKRDLGWQPTLTNEEILYLAYQDYIDSKHERPDDPYLSPNTAQPRLGVLRLLKWLS